MTTMTQSRTLLIHAHDPLIAALLGALVGEEAVVAFAEGKETLESAARRVKPRAILTDAPDSAPGDLTIPIVVFGSPEECARRRAAGTPCFSLPADHKALHDRVRNVLDHPLKPP